LNSRLELNILWLDTKIGIAIDQLQSGEKIPLTKYFFWPKTDAWDQVRSELETKSWVENSKKAEILYSISTILNQWQNSNDNTSTLMKKDTK
jgi:30S ribosomal protein 3|tara:strand:+ start:666 stop:941 length:276 start_codon:yes stop_codon:yes gene_type:complete